MSRGSRRGGGEHATALLLAYFYERDQDAGKYAYYGVMGLRHRGYKVAYAALGPDGFEVGRADPWGNSLRLPSGYAVVAGVEPFAQLAIARQNGLQSVAGVDGSCPAKALAELSLRTSMRDVAEELVSGEAYKWCAAIVLRSDGAFVIGRGAESRRPLGIGGYGFEALYAATESAPITLMGGVHRYDIGGGEALYGDRFSLERVSNKGRRRTCLFEYIYLARPDSIVDGINVYVFRREMGKRLARVHGAHVDTVVGVPETAIPYAIGYAEAKHARLEHGLVSTLGRVRTALAPVDVEERLMMLSLKLNPVPGIFEGKSVAIVDDSVVTGVTLKTVIQRLRRLHGAREVHVAVSSPKIVSRCRFRVYPLSEESLIARHLGDEDLARVLDADSITWLPLDEAISFLRKHGVEPCSECMR
ncbi:MAG: phosphoribosyltransferase family protein [Pyrodictiaceae archaeon]